MKNSINLADRRILIGGGILLILLGLLHIPVWMTDGSDWEGRVSWRKPILFGVSTGMTLWSLGWIAGALKPSRLAAVDRVASITTTGSLVIEVALITVQQWRGVASHFNQETHFDGWIDFAMLALICVAFVGIVYFGFRSLGKLQMQPEYVLSARLGMLFLIISCIIGFVISGYGYWRTSEGLPPETLGDNGVTKFPHGVAIHVLQILPAMVFVLAKLNFRPSIKQQFVWCTAGSFLSLLVFASAQTITGQARFEINSSMNYLLLLGAALLMLLPLALITKSVLVNRNFEQVLQQSKKTEK